jgi:hypothetical protein
MCTYAMVLTLWQDRVQLGAPSPATVQIVVVARRRVQNYASSENVVYS